MTRKHYIQIAAALLAARPGGPRSAVRMADQWRSDVLAIASVLAADNERFDRDRFLTAAGF